MKRTKSPGVALTRQETLGGLLYMAFQFVFLPSVLYAVNGMLKRPMSEGELNFLYYFINFIAMLVVFHGFLGRSAAQLRQHPMQVCEALILGTVAYYAFSWLSEQAVELLMPGFANRNNASIAGMFAGNRFLLILSTVVLVPPFEECIFRGLIFRSLYGKSPWLGYTVSVLSFAMVHILGFLDVYSPLEVCMAILQYLPAGLCLAWSYVRSGTIFAPILIHAAVNYITVTGLR